ncbi:hypothetical protein PHISCL_04863 [Aspergillus sclerotialis]|uniref:Rhodopsin domain-containing protein n=1 Tax=Aspergillus sclerotialis TaxID=2070753 RepID=A0A3A2ZXS6_9EURO|nr:hypothetical protein PHISCL_04863 [Aspergillus sclerotialis]
MGHPSLLVWCEIRAGRKLHFSILAGLGPLTAQILYAEAALLAPISFFPKVSILSLYREIFTIQRPMRSAIYFGLVLAELQSWPTLAFTSYYLAPHAGQTWSEFRRKLSYELYAYDVPRTLLYWVVAQGAAAVLLDLYIILLPIPLVLKLHLPRKQRLQVLGISSTALM